MTMNINNYIVPMIIACQQEEKKQRINYCYNTIESQANERRSGEQHDKLHRKLFEHDVASSIRKYI